MCGVEGTGFGIWPDKSKMKRGKIGIGRKILPALDDFFFLPWPYTIYPTIILYHWCGVTCADAQNRFWLWAAKNLKLAH